MPVIQPTGYCCAVSEIGYIGDDRSAEESMYEFCRHLWHGPYKHIETSPDAFYIFTGVLRHTQLEKYDDEPPPRDGKYGPEFRAFIEKHKLGKVVQSVTRNNRVNHPNHYLKVYVWAPDEDALRKWYLKKKGE